MRGHTGRWPLSSGVHWGRLRFGRLGGVNDSVTERIRELVPLLRRAWYRASVAEFLGTPDDEVLAGLVRGSEFSVLEAQRDAWLMQLGVLRGALAGMTGMVYLELVIPRMGRRVDAVVLLEGVVLAIEFKCDAQAFLRADIDQAFDYAADLKYFHETTHALSVVPVLVATEAAAVPVRLEAHRGVPGLYRTVCTNARGLHAAIDTILSDVPKASCDAAAWESGRYCPTPTIIEAARALYAGHHVADISRSEAGATNLTDTSEQLSAIIETCRRERRKAICFVTGVPGAGKTLVGLNIATQHNDPESELHSVFLSGNGPLVAILREALARDMYARTRPADGTFRKKDARSQVQAFIQNVHHFRDEYLRDIRAPVDHVVLFDEAQRAWDLDQTAAFMKRKKGVPDFRMSEPEFLISCMDRRQDWAVIVCLVGGGQEINTGEAGIVEWIEALQRSFHEWDVYLSPSLTDSEYGSGEVLEAVKARRNVEYRPALHLGVSMRSFRAETVSAFVKSVLDCEVGKARELLAGLRDRYPIALTRDLETAKDWVRERAGGSERYGIVVSSQAERLKPYAIDVRTPVNPVKWFLDAREDVRSSYYMEDVATEFHVQGLELDWVCVSWDGDFRYSKGGWGHYSFRGKKWQRIRKDTRQVYLKNAYRVLLTRARQGMVIFVPRGSTADPTREPGFYDATYGYLREVGLEVV